MSDLKLDDATLPVLFRRADSASLKAQKNHYRVLKIYLLLLVLSAAISFVWPDDRLAAAISAILFLVTFILSLIQANSRSTEIWYKGRAVAESVKTLSWRWIMQSEPYNTPDIRQAEQTFSKNLREILSVNQDLLKYFLPNADFEKTVSDAMRKMRNLPFGERLAMYQKYRVKDQAKWYKNKAVFNKHKARLWRIVAVVLNLLAFAFLTIRVFDPNRSFPTDVLATAAGSVVSWIEAKKYDELRSSYKLAADEIREIQELSSHVATDEQLASFVFDSESAFSREHTQWFARRA